MSYSVDNENRRAESAHRTREEYKQNEASLKKKQTDEINRLNKAHANSLRKLQADHGEQLDSVREKNQESLTDQDRKYQKEIEKIRDAHKNQSKQSAMQYENTIDYINDQRQAELEKQEKNAKLRESSLSENYENDRLKKDANFTRAVEEMRETQQNSIAKERDEIHSRNRKDNNLLRSNHDEKVSKLSMELQNTNDYKNAEIKSLRASNIMDKEKVEADKLNLLQQERKTHNVQSDIMRDEFGKNLNELREKYQRYSMESKSGLSGELENMKNISDVRINEAVGKREREMREMRADHDIDNFLVRKQAADEKRAYMQNTKQQLQKSDEMRSQIYDSVNKRTAEEIKDIVKRSDKTLDLQNKHYQGRLLEKDDKYAESIETQVKSLEIENSQSQKTAEINRQKLAYNLTREKNDMESYYQDMLSEKDRLHKQDLTDQRLKMTDEKKEVVRNLENKVRESDLKNMEKQNIMIQKYEKEIANLKDAHKAEGKRVVNQYEKRIDELERSFKTQIDSDRLASESREKQLKDQYSRQASSMEARHTEEKIKMATNVKT